MDSTSLRRLITDLGGRDSVLEHVHPGESLARVRSIHRGAADLVGPDGPLRVRARSDLVAAGDWVVHDQAQVLRVLPRHSLLSRQSASASVEHQLLVANIDTVFLVTSMNRDFSINRLLRMHAAVCRPEVEAVVVLSKADLDFGGQGRYLRQLDDALPDVAVVVTSVLMDLGIDDLRGWLGPGRSAVFVGTSGVGKSSLVNALLDAEVQEIQAVRTKDDRGQHTTTRREMLRLSGGGVILDSPGMRALALWDGDGLDSAFSDLLALAERCRFRDCGHAGEPGCAIQAGLDAGEVSEARVKAWFKLQREVAWQEGRRNQAARRAEHRAFSKKIRAMKKDRW